MKFLKKLLTHSHRGLPDSTHHGVAAPTVIPISAAAAAPPPPTSNLPPWSSEPPYPVRYPNTSNPTYYGTINHPHTSQPVSEPIYPVTHPNTSASFYYHGHNHNNHPHTTQPATAFPYQFQQDDHREWGREEWEVNTGNSVNKKGTQKGGNINAKNGSFAAGSAAPSRNGRFVLNTGGNTNEGDLQQSGNIEFVNGNVGFRGNPTAISPS